MLDDRVRFELHRLEAEDAAERQTGLRTGLLSLACGPEAGSLLFSLVAPIPGCRVLEIGASRGYSTIWLASAARLAGGHVVSLEQEPAKIAAWRSNLVLAGLDDHATLLEGDGFCSLTALPGPFDVVFLDAWKDDYEAFFGAVRPKLATGGAVVADNVHSNRTVAAYATARQSDRTLVSVTVPLGNGLELTTVP